MADKTLKSHLALSYGNVGQRKDTASHIGKCC